jgi:L-ascorbate metabolism protein UlaG (beta-lactamase superfamily)
MGHKRQPSAPYEPEKHMRLGEKREASGVHFEDCGFFDRSRFRRSTEPVIDISELPPLDFCILSHYHDDHFNQICEKRLDKKPAIVAGYSTL